ncbi:low molecular weight phosphatase family protein [soil metagenome]
MRLPTVAAVVKRALVICTANICRSPVVERLLRRSLDGAVDVDSDAWVVSSAGTADIWPPVDCHTIEAAASVGIDLSDHQRRTLTHDLIGTDGADLILAMTREQLRVVASLDPSAWPRTFTLRELARRAAASAPASENETFAALLHRIAGGRRAADMMRPDASDDITDPYGGSASEHATMVEQVASAVDDIVRHGPWAPPR